MGVPAGEMQKGCQHWTVPLHGRGWALPTNADLRRKPPFQPVKPFLRQTGPPSARSGVTLGSHPAPDPPNPDEPRGSAMITGLSRAHH